MNDDTDIGGPAALFPATQHSLVRAAASADPAVRKQAFELLIAAYWKAVYKYIRMKWGLGNEDAKDLTQAFFTRVLEKDFLDRFDAARARFRTFLRVCLEGFVANEQRAAGRRKRSAPAPVLSLDFAGASEEFEAHVLPGKTDPDDFFRQEWLRGLFTLAVEDLRRYCMTSGKEVHFALFERHDLEGAEAPTKPTYEDLGQEFGLPATQVTNYLALARRLFRRFVLERLRATSGSEGEF